jgi:pimeloyl-ACP methyl ester carboxylesterase
VPETRLANGVRLYWREAGDPAKSPVVWIHGGSVEDSAMMLPDLEPFFDRFRVLCPDTRGHRLSQRFDSI